MVGVRMKKQINCPHFSKESRRTSYYTYALINAELNLCNQCEKKLRKKIFQQAKDEDECNKLFENSLIKRLKKAKDRIESGDYVTEKEFFTRQTKPRIECRSPAKLGNGVSDKIGGIKSSRRKTIRRTIKR
jgi:hypothetical protein